MPSLSNILSTMATQWPWYWPLMGAIFGVVLGSFLNCARYRLPRGLSLRQPPSMCPACRTRLGVPDLVPILSYLALRGHCRHCHAKIGSTSLWLEVACATLGALFALAAQSFLLTAA